MRRFIVFLLVDQNTPRGGWKDVFREGGAAQSFDQMMDAMRAGAYAQHDDIFYDRVQVVDTTSGNIVVENSSASLREALTKLRQMRQALC